MPKKYHPARHRTKLRISQFGAGASSCRESVCAGSHGRGADRAKQGSEVLLFCCIYFEGFLKMIFVELKVAKNGARAQVEVDESWIDAMERKEAKEREVWDSFWSLLTIRGEFHGTLRQRRRQLLSGGRGNKQPKRGWHQPTRICSTLTKEGFRQLICIRMSTHTHIIYV